MSDIQIATAQDLIGDSMLLMLAQTPGEPVNSSEMFFGLRELNRLTGKWSIIRTFCFQMAPQVFTFGVSQNAYTIGPTGANFTGPRPTRILAANIIINNVSPVVYIPVRVVNWDQWQNIRVRAIPSGVPTIAYYDSGYTSVGQTGGVPNPGYGTIYFWGEPVPSSYQCELWTPTQLPYFTALSGTGAYFALPPGYEEAIVCTLAEMLSISYGRPITQDLKDRARKGRAALQALNSKAPIVNSDVPGSNNADGFGWNWLNGGFGGSGS